VNRWGREHSAAKKKAGQQRRDYSLLPLSLSVLENECFWQITLKKKKKNKNPATAARSNLKVSLRRFHNAIKSSTILAIPLLSRTIQNQSLNLPQSGCSNLDPRAGNAPRNSRTRREHYETLPFYPFFSFLHPFSPFPEDTISPFCHFPDNNFIVLGPPAIVASISLKKTKKTRAGGLSIGSGHWAGSHIKTKIDGSGPNFKKNR